MQLYFVEWFLSTKKSKDQAVVIAPTPSTTSVGVGNNQRKACLAPEEDTASFERLHANKNGLQVR